MLSKQSLRAFRFSNVTRVAASVALVVMTSAGATACRTVAAQDASDVKFYGKNATYTRLTFSSSLLFKLPDDYQGKLEDVLAAGSPTKEAVERQLNDQLDHLTGVFLHYKEFGNRPGAVYGHPDVKILGAVGVEGSPRLARINYSYSDRAAFAKELVLTSPVQRELVLPAEVTGIYEKAMVDGTNTCVAEDNGAAKFWYYWSPSKAGCSFKEGDLVKITATLTPLASTTETYPDYAKLFGDNGNGKAFEVVWISGPAESSSETDVGVAQYRAIVAAYKSAPGFTVESEKDDTVILVKRGESFDIKLKFYLRDASDSDFEELAANGLKNADVFVYQGHSGYGANLNPERLSLTKSTALQDKSQIYFFGGCRTFRYYNARYFDLKEKNLDIVTTTSPSYFVMYADVGRAFLDNLLSPGLPTWQTTMDAMHNAERKIVAGWGSSYQSTMAVNGDEDNPTTRPVLP